MSRSKVKDSNSSTSVSNSGKKASKVKSKMKQPKQKQKVKQKVKQRRQPKSKIISAVASAQKNMKLRTIGLLALALIASSIIYTISLSDQHLLNGPFMLDAGPKIEFNPDIRSIGTNLMLRRVGSETTHSNLNYNDPSRPLASLSFQLNYRFGGYDSIQREVGARVFRITNFVIHVVNSVLVGYLAHLLFRALRFNVDSCSLSSNTSNNTSNTSSSSTSSGSNNKYETLLVACASTALFASSPFNHAVAMYTYARSDLMGATFTFLYVIIGLRRLLDLSCGDYGGEFDGGSGSKHEHGRTTFCFSIGMFITLMLGLLSKQLVVVVPGAFMFLHLILLELPCQWRQQKQMLVEQLQNNYNNNNNNNTESASASTCLSLSTSASTSTLSSTTSTDSKITNANTSTSTSTNTNGGGRGGRGGSASDSIVCMANVLHSLTVTIYCHLPSFITVGCYFIFRLVKFGGVSDLEMIGPSAVGYGCYVMNQPYAWFRYGMTMFYPKGIALDHNLIQQLFCKTSETKVASIALFLVFLFMVVRTFNIARVKRSSILSSTAPVTSSSSSLSSKVGTDPTELILLAGLGFFGLNILPSSVVQTTDVYCERRAYAGGAGLYCAFAICLFEILKRLTASTSTSTTASPTESSSSTTSKASFGKNSVVYTSVITTIVSYFMVSSGKLNPTFYSTEALWRDVVKQYPSSIRGMTNLANALTEQIQNQLHSCNADTYQIYDPKKCAAFNATLYAEAEGFYNELLSLRSNDAYAMSGLARLNFLTGKMDKAIEFWRMAAANDRLLAPNAHKMIGTQLHKMQRLEEAIVEYNKAMEIAPDFNAELYNNLALAYLNSGKPELGVKIFKEGMKRFPNDKLLLTNKNLFTRASSMGGNMGSSNRGSNMGGRGNSNGNGDSDYPGGSGSRIPPQARRVTSDPNDPNFPVYLFHQGLQHHQAGEPDKAEVFYRKILEVDKNPIPDVYNNLALIVSHAGKLSEGRELWLKGIERDPKNEQLLANKAFIFRGG